MACRRVGVSACRRVRKSESVEACRACTVVPASSGSDVDEGYHRDGKCASIGQRTDCRGREGEGRRAMETVASLGRTKSEGAMCDIVM
ncbi:hypothetical protein HBH98_004550 [Parastagonospora nodorum]|nr:hypothetical protein HBH53_218970 [Parastagonospora nodorum]KAH3970409.1 hypothetical protein HBH52_164850 [Parastagonospora nodorum]KAH4150920.1 hypothetical protein HBH43_244870 [Parastagonospora nodorum]KAH4214605.1 hypothetical protein HBI95_010620 [Parastagonospora nodorum]KAH4298420.1 hypothetical protein HBI01_130500 [Parastagonospora nodorum]